MTLLMIIMTLVMCWLCLQAAQHCQHVLFLGRLLRSLWQLPASLRGMLQLLLQLLHC
jgi:hypothetical protein